MSSYVVHPKVINQIVTYLDVQTNRGNYRYLLSHYNIVPNMKEALGDKEERLQATADSLWSLNIEAVQQRYPNDTVNTMPGSYQEGKLIHHTVYKYEEANTLQVYKSLQCLIYQCSEGNVPDTIEYKFLVDLKHAIAEDIIESLPDYDKAHWDIE